MSAVHTLVGTRYSAAGRKTGETKVTLRRDAAADTAGDVVLSVGNRSVWVKADALRDAVVALTGTPVPPAATTAAEPLTETDTDLVHLRHFHDGYPLCWPMDREGDFAATGDESKVTCRDCRQIVAGWED